MCKQNNQKAKIYFIKQIIDRTVLLEIFYPTIGEVKFSKVKLSNLESPRYKLDKMHTHVKLMPGLLSRNMDMNTMS